MPGTARSGGYGIGQGCALLFARQGAKVFASDISEQTAQVTAAQAQVAGFPFAGVHKVDLGQEAEVRVGGRCGSQ